MEGDWSTPVTRGPAGVTNGSLLQGLHTCSAVAFRNTHARRDRLPASRSVWSRNLRAPEVQASRGQSVFPRRWGRLGELSTARQLAQRGATALVPGAAARAGAVSPQGARAASTDDSTAQSS